MSVNLMDDLEEGEIADEIEPLIEKKAKPLPRRYILNDKGKNTRHKKKCKHAAQHHKREESKFDLSLDLKTSKKHRKACPKHSIGRYTTLSVHKLSPPKDKGSLTNIDNKGPHYNSSNMCLGKSAFKNFQSPPRKVSKSDNFNLKFLSSPETDSFPKLLSEYKKSRNEFIKLKNNKYNGSDKSSSERSSLTTKEKSCEISEYNSLVSNYNCPDKSSNKRSDDLVSNQNSCESSTLLEIPKINSDEDDEEELRRIALSTCSKRLNCVQEVSENSNSSKANSSTDLQAANVCPSDNYDMVDMEVDDAANLENTNNGLFVIDTTPSYFCEMPQSGLTAAYDHNFNANMLHTGVQNGFIPSLNIEEPFQSLNNQVISQDLSNDLYLTNFETMLADQSHLPTSQLDEDFEEELLRAELIANLQSVRQKSEINLHLPQMDFHNPVYAGSKAVIDESVFQEERTVSSTEISLSLPQMDFDNPVNAGSKAVIAESVFQEERTVSMKKDIHLEENIFDRVVSIDNEPVNEPVYKEERTVSIVSDIPKKEAAFKEVTRSVSTVLSKTDLANSINSQIRKGVDIKVKLNNLKSSSNTVTTSNIVTLPQERIIISLNNESSTDDSDQEDATEVKCTKSNSAVASLEALISNARHESDGKKDSPSSGIASNALSWLSKAQQEEYNSLMKILAKKQQPPVQPSQNEVKKASEEASITLLGKKLLIARKHLDKEKSIMNITMKDLVKKKRAYMVSKLKTQLLKEQLLAAERVRKSNLQQWTKCSSELQILKKSVSKRQVIINALETKTLVANSLFPSLVQNGLSPVSNHIPESNNITL